MLIVAGRIVKRREEPVKGLSALKTMLKPEEPAAILSKSKALPAQWTQRSVSGSGETLASPAFHGFRGQIRVPAAKPAPRHHQRLDRLLPECSEKDVLGRHKGAFDPRTPPPRRPMTELNSPLLPLGQTARGDWRDFPVALAMKCLTAFRGCQSCRKQAGRSPFSRHHPPYASTMVVRGLARSREGSSGR